MESHLITPIHLPPLKPPFPRWYDPNTHCNFHCGNPGHSIENCTALKNRVQDLIQVGSVELETSNEQGKGGSQFSSFSRGKTSVMKQGDEVPTVVKRKIQWDPIPVTYTELFPMLVEIGHIEPFQLPPLTPPFPRWYNAHVRCDYHAGNPGHSTENCTALKRKVRDLIKDGKLKVEDLGRPIEAENLSRTKVEMPRQEEEIPNEANFGKTTMSKEKVPIAKAGFSSTTKRSKERSCKLDKEEEEKKTLQELA